MVKTIPKISTIYIAQGCVLRGNQVLLFKRNEPDNKTLHMNLELPGGKIEIHESPERAAVREIWEETGVVAKIDYLIPFTFEKKQGDKKIKIFCYKCDFRDEILNRPAELKVKEAGWYNINDLYPLNIQTGSLMFLLYALEKEGIIQDFNLISDLISQIELKCIDPKKNKYKIYRIIIRRYYQLEKEYEVAVSWGRIHFSHASYEKSREYKFDNRAKMLKFVGNKLWKKYEKDYKISKLDHHFPKLEVLFKYQKIEEPKQIKLDL